MMAFLMGMAAGAILMLFFLVIVGVPPHDQDWEN